MNNILKDARQKADLTQNQIAEQLGCTLQYYNMIENGKKQPSVQLAKKISKILKIKWTIFFNEEINQKFNNNDRLSDQTQSAL